MYLISSPYDEEDAECVYVNAEAVSVLLKAGAKVDDKDNAGKSVIEYVNVENRDEILAILK